MADLAELGLKVDSAPVVAATEALKDFSKEAQTAGESADDMEASLDQVSKTAAMGGPKVKGYTEALSQTYGVSQKLTSAQVNVIRGLEDQAAKLSVNGREYAQYIALRRAGTTADTEAGVAIAALAGSNYDLAHAGERVGESLSSQRVKFRAMSEAANLAGGQLGGVIQKAGMLTIGMQHLNPTIIAGTAVVGLYIAALTVLVKTLKEAAEVNITAKQSGTSGDFIQGLGNAFSAMGGQSKEIVGGMVQFNQQVDDAARGVGSLAVLLRGTGTQVKGTEDAFFKVVDLISNARSEAEKFSLAQQAGLPSSAKAIEFYSQGAKKIREQQDEYDKLSLAQLKAAEELDKKFNAIWTNFTTMGKKAIVDAFSAPPPDGWFLRLARAFKNALQDPLSERDMSAGNLFIDNFPEGTKTVPYKPPKASPGNTFNPQAYKDQVQLEQLHVSTLGQLAMAQELAALKQKELNVANLDGANINREQQKQLVALALAQANGSFAVNQQADSIRIQTATMNMSAGAAAAYTAEQTKFREALLLGNKMFDLNTEAGRKNVQMLHDAAVAQGEAVEAQARAQVKSDIRFGQKTAFFTQEDVQIAQQLKSIYPDVGEAMASVEAQALRMNNAMQSASQTISSGLTSSLVSIVNGSATAGEAFRGFGKIVIDTIAKMIIQLSIVGPLMRALGFGGFGAIDPVQNGGFGNGGFNFMDAAALKSANGNVFHNGSLQMFARGGLITRPTVFPMANGGIGFAGEAGTEAIMPLARDGKGRLGVRGQGSGGTVIYQTVNQDFRGTDASQRAFLTQQIRASSIQTRKAAVTDVAATKRNVPGYLQ